MSTYPDEPGAVAGCDTSEQAAQTIDASSMRRKVRSYVDSQGASGATCDEVEVALEMRHQTASARVRELVLRGELRDSGARRPTRSGRGARVYVTDEPDEVEDWEQLVLSLKGNR